MKFFICGHKIFYSKSPLIYHYWFQEYNIKASYEIVDIDSTKIETFFSLVKENKFQGGNVTIPYKQKFFELISCKDDIAEAVGAMNIVYYKNGILYAGNTDTCGFSAHLDLCLPHWRKSSSTIVLGAGGSAYAIIHALQKAGIENIYVMNRTFEHALQLVKKFGNSIKICEKNLQKELLLEADLIINTLPPCAQEAYDLCFLSKNSVFVDIAYPPFETRFLKMAKKRGLHTIDAAGMLLHQATFSFNHWFGIQPNVTKKLYEIIYAEK